MCFTAQHFTSKELDEQNCCNSVLPEYVDQERADGGIFLGRWCSRVCLQTSQRTAPLALKVHLFKATWSHTETLKQSETQKQGNSNCFYN